MLHRSQKFSEIFSAQGPAMLLFAEHDSVIEIENDSWIGAAQEAELEGRETESLEKHHHVMASSLFDDFELTNHAGAACCQDRGRHT
jgi:hypothetical protein